LYYVDVEPATGEPPVVFPQQEVQMPQEVRSAYVDSPDGLNLRDTPSTDGNIITALRDKTEVSVDDYDPAADWLYVTANGYSGWVKSEYIALR
jgi:uncharacterized protein YgiM (DUF1202 family)